MFGKKKRDRSRSPKGFDRKNKIPRKFPPKDKRRFFNQQPRDALNANNQLANQPMAGLSNMNNFNNLNLNLTNQNQANQEFMKPNLPNLTQSTSSVPPPSSNANELEIIVMNRDQW